MLRILAVVLCTISMSFAVRAQGLPTLTVTNFGSFLVRNQTSITPNDPGVNSSYSVVGGGNELWGPADKGIYGYFPVTGDFDVKVRVESLEPVHRYAKTGLMARETLSSTSRMISLFATPTGPTELPFDDPTGEDQVEFNFRRGSGDGGANNINLGSPGYPNAWLRLARRGTVFYGLVSRDGTNWTQSASVDTDDWTGAPFRTNAIVGIGSSSHEDTELVRSELRDFSAVTTVGPVQILSQPAAMVGLEGSTVTISVGVSDPVDATYQWFANNQAIPNATNATYTTARLTAANDNTAYKVTVTGKNNSTVTSSEAMVSVEAIDIPEFPDLVLDFDDGEVPFGTAVYGSATVDPAGGSGGSGGLVLIPRANNQTGSFVIDDFNVGALVDSFTVAFKLKIGPGSARPADGFSFSFGPNIPTATFPAPQQGVGPGLAVSFDIYDNGDLEAPAIDVFYGVDPASVPQNLKGNIVHQPVALGDLVTSRFVDVIIRMNPDGKLDLVYDGEVIAYHVQTPFAPVANARFGFGAYAGGLNALEAIDNVLIDTSTLNPDAYLSSISPLGNNVSASPQLQVKLLDQETFVDASSVQLQFNSAPVTPVITRDDLTAETTVSYQVPALLEAGSTNSITIIWSDSSQNRHTNTASFKVGNYMELPASAALPLDSGNEENSGFRVRIYQIADALNENSGFAEAVLSGQRGENLADLTITDETGYFSDPSITTTIDYDVNAAPLGLSTFPGIPGITDSKENFAGEVLTYIAFPRAGFYQMGVRSDDGFVLTAGNTSDPVQLGSFEGAREPSDSIFGFVVPQAGVYPFRLLYYQGGGGALLRWFSVGSDGRQLLINDPNEPLALKAFQSVTGGTPAPRITLSRSGADLVLTWSGSGALESASSLTAPVWTPVNSANSPFTVPTGAGMQFFRVRQ